MHRQAQTTGSLLVFALDIAVYLENPRKSTLVFSEAEDELGKTMDTR